MIELTINGKKVTAPEGSTILAAAELAGIKIPHLCKFKDIHAIGACRICVVEVEGARNLQASCVVKAANGMVVHTNSKRVREARKVLYDLMISDHPKECTSCSRNQNCELQNLGYTLGIRETKMSGAHHQATVDVTPAFTRDNRKCILCRRCVTICNEVQQVGAIGSQNRGFHTYIGAAMGNPLLNANCAMCGQCVAVCPTGALSVTDGMERVWAALGDPNKRVIVQAAPAVRAALGEAFGYPCGTPVTGKLAAALRAMGFDDVFDTNFAADVTIMEEGTELIKRLLDAASGGDAVLPMITSCSPGWIKHCEHAYPDQLAHLSSCKSPHTMMGALIKSFYAQKIGVDPKDIYVVSVMPCVAKKYEIQRPEMQVDGHFDVDAVITTRELSRMIKTAGIDFDALEEAEFDPPLGLSSGAADIFGVTGGVMEAALRTAYAVITGRTAPFEAFAPLHYDPNGGICQIKKVELKIEGAKPEYAAFEGVTLRAAATSGLAGSNILMDEVRAGKSPYQFIEVMGCPGGCIAGGGQPRSTRSDFRELRAKALYSEDERKTLRMSHENPDLQALYREYLGEAGGEKAHHLLHTTYTPRGDYNDYQG